MNGQVIQLVADKCDRGCSRDKKPGLVFCEKCQTGFVRFMLEKGKNSDYSPVQYLKDNPLRRKISSPVFNQLIPGYLISGPWATKLAEIVLRLADSNLPVHIQGETGVGKEGVARALHLLGSRKNHVFHPVNCGAIPKSLAETQFFGHQRGSFTGAVYSSPGVLKQTDRGSLFLDEIDSLPKSVQGKLLRFLEDGEIYSIGATKPTKVDVRIISATNKSLKKGGFRKDLRYRVEGVKLKIPPLRERRDEIPDLVKHFLPEHLIKESVIDAFLNYRWPGNIRQLKLVIESAKLFAQGEEIDLEHIPVKVYKPKSNNTILQSG